MKTLMAVCLQCITLFCVAQAKKEIIVGQPFPYQGLFKFSSSKDSVNIGSFRGSRVIIDLFGPTCSVCFASLPKTNALEKKYKKDIQFLLIGYDNGKTAAIYQKFKEKLNLEFSVAFDTKLFKAVSLEAMPTYIWIDEKGIVRAVTIGPENTNAENLEAFIAGAPLEDVTDAKPIPFDTRAPYLLTNNGGNDTTYQLRTVMNEWKRGMPFYGQLDMKFIDGRQFINLIGEDVNNLYNLAYWGRMLGRFGEPLYGKVWPQPLVEPDENTKKLFCFALAYHGDKAPDAQEILRSCLGSYFNYDVKIETRSMPYWSFTVDSTKWSKLKTKETAHHGEWEYSGFDYKYISMKFLLRELSYVSRDHAPYIDESGISDMIDLNIDAPLTERDLLFKALREKGIIVTSREKPMQVLVLTKRNSAATQ